MKWVIRLPLILGAYHLFLFGLAFTFFRHTRLPPIFLIIGELPALPCALVLPHAAGIMQSITGSYPTGNAEGALFVIVPLILWILYGIIIGFFIDLSPKHAREKTQ
jgi:hypothetical protein